VIAPFAWELVPERWFLNIGNRELEIGPFRNQEQAMKRRQWLWQGSLALGGALGGWAGFGDRPVRAATRWSYDGPTGPNHWSELDPAFATCGLGQRQSPIDLAAQKQLGPVDLRLDYQSVPLTARNTGRSIFVDCPPGTCILHLGDRPHDLLQFHFHHPSEHHRAGRTFPAEVHFVHRDRAGSLLVLGLWLTAAPTQAAASQLDRAAPQLLQDLLARAPIALGTSLDRTWQGNPANLLPPIPRSLYHYQGSLTTPPCSEGVTWLLFPEPQAIAPALLTELQTRLGTNARPLQAQLATPKA